MRRVPPRPAGGHPAARARAGPSCVSDALCAGTAAATVCDASGEVATCEEVSPGCRKVKSATACSGGKVCQDGACRCESGCAKDEAGCSVDGKLRTCEVAAGADAHLPRDRLRHRLTCTSSHGPGQCVCGAPIRRHPPRRPPVGRPCAQPSGALSPPPAASPASPTRTRRPRRDPLPPPRPGDARPGTFPLVIPDPSRSCVSLRRGICNPEEWIIRWAPSRPPPPRSRWARTRPSPGHLEVRRSPPGLRHLREGRGRSRRGAHRLGRRHAEGRSGQSASGTCEATLSRSARRSSPRGGRGEGSGAQVTVAGGIYSRARRPGLVAGRRRWRRRTTRTTRPCLTSPATASASPSEAPAGPRAATLLATSPRSRRNGRVSARQRRVDATLSLASNRRPRRQGIDARGRLRTLSGGTIVAATAGPRRRRGHRGLRPTCESPGKPATASRS
jgi:hypothetical protein